jgi:hypothetical protein
MTDKSHILLMSGCGFGDTVFTLDKRITGEEICWNTTRIQHDADAGVFGPPIKRAFKTWPDMTPAERANIDWQKVAAFARSSEIMAKPGLAVDLDAGMETHRHIVEGNHRICARELRGLPFFELYVVPRQLEQQYRVTLRDGNGKPVHLGMEF